MFADSICEASKRENSEFIRASMHVRTHPYTAANIRCVINGSMGIFFFVCVRLIFAGLLLILIGVPSILHFLFVLFRTMVLLHSPAFLVLWIPLPSINLLWAAAAAVVAANVLSFLLK